MGNAAEAIAEPSGARAFLRRFVHTRSAMLGFVLVALAMLVREKSPGVIHGDKTATSMANATSTKPSMALRVCTKRRRKSRAPEGSAIASAALPITWLRSGCAGRPGRTTHPR